MNHEAYRRTMLEIERLEKLQPVFNSREYNSLQNLYREVKKYETDNFR